mmetsp:Transcript_376/g.942  ORF Transcript_376/g.942 Transcript_376/m.942 type:complete len:246 (+) Transcript_376:195-932(+)
MRPCAHISCSLQPLQSLSPRRLAATAALDRMLLTICTRAAPATPPHPLSRARRALAPSPHGPQRPPEPFSRRRRLGCAHARRARRRWSGVVEAKVRRRRHRVTDAHHGEARAAGRREQRRARRFVGAARQRRLVDVRRQQPLALDLHALCDDLPEAAREGVVDAAEDGAGELWLSAQQVGEVLARDGERPHVLGRACGVLPPRVADEARVAERVAVVEVADHRHAAVRLGLAELEGALSDNDEAR